MGTKNVPPTVLLLLSSLTLTTRGYKAKQATARERAWYIGYIYAPALDIARYLPFAGMTNVNRVMVPGCPRVFTLPNTPFCNSTNNSGKTQQKSNARIVLISPEKFCPVYLALPLYLVVQATRASSAPPEQNKQNQYYCITNNRLADAALERPSMPNS